MFLSLSGLTTPAPRVFVTGRHRAAVTEWVVGDGYAQGPPLPTPPALLSEVQFAVCYFHFLPPLCVCSWLNSHDDVTGGAGIPRLVG